MSGQMKITITTLTSITCSSKTYPLERNDHLEGPNANNRGGETQNNSNRRDFNNRTPRDRPNNHQPDNRPPRDNRPTNPPPAIGRQYKSNANAAANEGHEDEEPDEMTTDEMTR
eukprot:scaffold10081_cov100-Attheya_sp.AAC.1